MKYNRQIDGKIKNHFNHYKQSLIVLGARQVGKTTMLKRLFPEATYLLLDEKPIKDALESYSMPVYRQIIGDTKQVIIDEIHLLSNPGRAVKILYDNDNRLQIIVTGSSSLHIKNKTSESMAGRSIYYYLYPLSYGEYLFQTGILNQINNNIFERIIEQDESVIIKKYDEKKLLNNLLIYGLYPNTITLAHNKKYLRNLATSAVFKDILELNLIENRSKAEELLKILAYQIGNLISYDEIAKKLKMSSNTVRRYIDIFEQSFLIYRLYPFSKNKRAEIGKTPKIYFWDVGLRNAVINNFDEIKVRPDAGALFENFVISEVKKAVVYTDFDYQLNYWRLKNGSEVDLILHNHKKLIGCEIKLTDGKISKAFTNRYPDAETHIVTSDNFN